MPRLGDVGLRNPSFTFRCASSSVAFLSLILLTLQQRRRGANLDLFASAVQHIRIVREVLALIKETDRTLIRGAMGSSITCAERATCI